MFLLYSNEKYTALVLRNSALSALKVHNIFHSQEGAHLNEQSMQLVGGFFCTVLHQTKIHCIEPQFEIVQVFLA